MSHCPEEEWKKKKKKKKAAKDFLYLCLTLNVGAKVSENGAKAIGEGRRRYRYRRVTETSMGTEFNVILMVMSHSCIP